MITQAELKHLLHYDPTTGMFTWVNPTSNRVSRGSPAGYTHHSGYTAIQLGSRTYQAHRLAWLFVYGVLPPNDIDHIDRVRHNNKINNLRLSSRQENMQNKSTYRTNSSGFTGVSYKKRINKWQASIGVNKKTKYLGVFSTPEEAYAAYLDAKRELHKFNPAHHV